jgi:AraC-like DNA-binding protein
MDVLGPVSVIVRNSRTVRDAIDAAGRYLFVHSPAMVLERGGWDGAPDVAFTFELREPGLPEVIQGYEVAMAVAVRILHLVGGSDATPTSIAFRHVQQGSDTAYGGALGCPVQFGKDWCGFVLSGEIADRGVAGADTATRRMARRYLDARYIPPTAPLSERVADLARSLLPTGQCTIDAIATELALHPRTLQRQLAAEGARCQQIIERERRTLAARYLANPDMALNHVAGLLGYTEQSALNRSCRRWFGQTPRQYRAAMIVAAR